MSSIFKGKLKRYSRKVLRASLFRGEICKAEICGAISMSSYSLPEKPPSGKSPPQAK